MTVGVEEGSIVNSASLDSTNKSRNQPTGGMLSSRLAKRLVRLSAVGRAGRALVGD
jgi:hypothetical protein